jgi:hypothetical protein
MRSLTEVLVSLATNVFILFLCLGVFGFFLFGLFYQLIEIKDWLFSKGGKKTSVESPFVIILWWGIFVLIPLIIWFFNK